MNKILLRHLISLLLVTLLLILSARILDQNEREKIPPLVKEWLALPYMDMENDADRELALEMLDYYAPENHREHIAFIDELGRYSRRQRQNLARGLAAGEGLGGGVIKKITGMYIRFIILFLIAFMFSYYGSVTLGTYLFIRENQENSGWRRAALDALRRIYASGKQVFREKQAWRDFFVNSLKTAGAGMLYLIFFSPAYVIAYTFKSRFDTDMFFFVVVLGVISNGMLITYTEKFYTFLQQEKNKGYVALAGVKGLWDNFRFGFSDGIAFKYILRWRKRFPGHIMDVIYENARYQFFRALKEMAAYLISSLIITEMALNVQGHLSYGMLQYLYYGDYAPVALIVLGLFWLVKLTEIVIDMLALREDRRLGYAEK